MDPVPTQYIDRDGAALAYQVFGDGPADVVNFAEIVLHLDLMWTDPDLHHNNERFARFARTILMQRRGFGLSDQVTYAPTVEQQADDVLAVMDAVGVRRATLGGILGTCAPLILVAARAPERVSGLVLLNPLACGLQAREDRHGWTESDVDEYFEGYRHAFDHWGSGGTIDMYDPVLATGFNRRLMGMLERCSATPAAAKAYYESMLEFDVRDALKSVQVPTHVLWIPSTPFPEAYGRYVADLIPGATFHLLPATQRGASIGQSFVPVVDHVEKIATGTEHMPDADRFLGTVLFTDVVSSTELLASIGDAQYQELRAAHERLVRLTVESSGGQLISVVGDGTLSVFDGPTKAVRCAEEICRGTQDDGLAVRCGVHVGELQRDGMNVTGLTVHTGARVGAAAGPGEVLVSKTVRDLVAGSGLKFASRGEHELRGVPGTWELFAVAHAGDQIETLPAEESMKTSMDKMVLQTARTAPAFVRAAVRLGNAIERRRARAS